MRNLKKVLSLVLCLAMMLSVMVVGAGAAFGDQDKIENAEAVDSLPPPTSPVLRQPSWSLA